MSRERLDLPPVLAEPPRHWIRRRIIVVAEMYRRHRGIVLFVVQALAIPVIALLIILLAHLFPIADHTGPDCAGQGCGSYGP